MISETCKACAGSGEFTAKTADGDVEREPCTEGVLCANCSRCFVPGTLVPVDNDEDVCSECDEQLIEAAEAQRGEDSASYHSAFSAGLLSGNLRS